MSTIILKSTAAVGLFGQKTGLFKWAFPLTTLLPAILWAVPKKKTSHSKKRMRASNKALADRSDIVPCSACGNYKLRHHLCLHCYKDLRSRVRNEQVVRGPLWQQ